jgi:hypothetical protein
MSRDDGGAGLAGTDERRLQPVVEADEVARADGDRVRGLERVDVVVGELEPRQDEQVVVAARPLGLRGDLGEVVGVVPCAHAQREPLRRRVGADNVVGDGEHVEAVRPVEIDELGKGQCSVAPPRVSVELAQQGLDLPAHPSSGCVSPDETWGDIRLRRGKEPVTAPTLSARLRAWISTAATSGSPRGS